MKRMKYEKGDIKRVGNPPLYGLFSLCASFITSRIRWCILLPICSTSQEYNTIVRINHMIELGRRGSTLELHLTAMYHKLCDLPGYLWILTTGGELQPHSCELKDPLSCLGTFLILTTEVKIRFRVFVWMINLLYQNIFEKLSLISWTTQASRRLYMSINVNESMFYEWKYIGIEMNFIICMFMNV